MNGKTKISKSFSLKKYKEKMKRLSGNFKKAKNKKIVNKNNQDYSQKGFF